MSGLTLILNVNNRIISPFSGVEQPLWGCAIASDLISKGNEVKILDAEVLNLSYEETIVQVRDMNPKHIIIVAMGSNPNVSSTMKMGQIKKVVDNLIGEYDIKIAGLHPSSLPQQTKSELGIEVLRGKCFEGTPDLPYHLLPMDKYIAHNWHTLHDGSPRQPYAVTYTSMNCPYSCNFCSLKALYNWKNNVYYRDSSAFIKEIDLLVNKYGVRNIKFWDEHFTVNHNHVNEICDKLIERHYDLNIWAYARVDTVEPKTLDKMWKAGINWLGFGFESGSDEVLNNVSKKSSLSQAKQAVKQTHEAGINVIGNFIFGLSGDSLQTMQRTLDFAKLLEIEFVNMYYCESLPGTPLYNESEKDWDKFGQFNKEQPDTLARKFRDEAFNDYFLDPNYLNHIRQRFGEQSVKQIKDMIAFGKPHTRY